MELVFVDHHGPKEESHMRRSSEGSKKADSAGFDCLPLAAPQSAWYGCALLQAVFAFLRHTRSSLDVKRKQVAAE